MCLSDLFHVLDLHDERNHMRRHRAGSLDYMPPEMILSEPAGKHKGTTLGTCQGHFITPAVDVWQVGLLIHFTLQDRAFVQLATVGASALLGVARLVGPCIGYKAVHTAVT